MSNKPCKSNHFFKYSPQWAQNIVWKVLQKYARAAEILEEKTGVSFTNLWMCLATNSEKWAIFRDIIKRIDYIGQRKGFDTIGALIDEYTTTQVFSNEHYKGSNRALIWATEDLTLFREYLTILGQGLRGC